MVLRAWEIIKKTNGLICMVNYAHARSGSKYAIGREEWKAMTVGKLMYGCGTLVLYQREWDALEV